MEQITFMSVGWTQKNLNLSQPCESYDSINTQIMNGS
jgi:hypothetical protein